MEVLDAGRELPGTLHLGSVATRFGPGVLAHSDGRVLYFGFADDLDAVRAHLAQKWGAQATGDDGTAQRLCDALFANDAQMLVRGTDWQIGVWRALLKIPAGHTNTYGKLASALSRPQAARAVGSAAGANDIAVGIPCHRLLGGAGAGGYKWGTHIKAQLLQHEQAR